MPMLAEDLIVKSRLENGNFIIGHPNGNTFNNIVQKYITYDTKRISWKEEENLKKVKNIEMIEKERSNMYRLLKDEKECQRYSCIFMECDKFLTFGLHDIHMNESHNLTRVIRGQLSNSKNILPINNDVKCFEKNKTILALEMELEEKKFYFIVYHEIEYFTFHVVIKSEDVNDEKRYLYNLTIVDGSKVCNYLLIWYTPI